MGVAAEQVKFLRMDNTFARQSGGGAFEHGSQLNSVPNFNDGKRPDRKPTGWNSVEQAFLSETVKSETDRSS